MSQKETDQNGVEETVKGAEEEVVTPELVVTGTVESLEKGLSEGEMALIKMAGEKAKEQGKQLVIRYRLNESEAELVEKYGGENKDLAVAQKVIYEKLRLIIPEKSSVGSVLGGQME